MESENREITMDEWFVVYAKGLWSLYWVIAIMSDGEQFEGKENDLRGGVILSDEWWHEMELLEFYGSWSVVNLCKAMWRFIWVEEVEAMELLEYYGS
jgi:hypothetical protein